MLTPSQNEFLELKAKHAAFYGGREAGKTYALREGLIKAAEDHQLLRAAFVCRGLYDLQVQFIKPIENRSELKLEVSQACRMQYRLPNGSIIRLLYGRRLEDFYRYAGLEFDIIAIDEAQRFTQDEYRFIETMNRSRRNGFPRMLYTFEPYGVEGSMLHNWCKNLFIGRVFSGDKNPDDYACVNAKPETGWFKET